MPDSGPPLGWSDEDIEDEADVGPSDLMSARQWNARHFPPPMQRLNEAPVAENEEDARTQAIDNR